MYWLWFKVTIPRQKHRFYCNRTEHHSMKNILKKKKKGRKNKKTKNKRNRRPRGTRTGKRRCRLGEKGNVKLKRKKNWRKRKETRASLKNGRKTIRISSSELYFLSAKKDYQNFSIRPISSVYQTIRDYRSFLVRTVFSVCQKRLSEFPHHN